MYINLKIKRPLFLIIIPIFMSLFFATLLLSKDIIFSVVSESTDYIKVPILMYHSILKTSKSRGKFIISPSTFEEDLKYIKDNGYTTIVMQDLINYVYENKDRLKQVINLLEELS